MTTDDSTWRDHKRNEITAVTTLKIVFTVSFFCLCLCVSQSVILRETGLALSVVKNDFDEIIFFNLRERERANHNNKMCVLL